MKKVILVLAANPKNTPDLRLEQEIRDITDALNRVGQASFELKSELAVRLQDIRRAMLDHKPLIVHFCGHGKGINGLVFEDETGNERLVEPNALAEFFGLFTQEAKIECVVLNACYSELQAKAIAEHIDYVVGMRGGISDAAALEFSPVFYEALNAGKSIEFSYRIACNAIRLKGLPDHLVPILKSRKLTEEDRNYLSQGTFPLPDDEEVRAAIEHWQETYCYIPFPAYLVDFSQRLLDWNRYAPRLLGMKYGDPATKILKGITIFDLTFDVAPRFINIENGEEYLVDLIHTMKAQFRPYKGETWYSERIEKACKDYLSFRDLWYSVPENPTVDLVLGNTVPIALRMPDKDLLRFRLVRVDFINDPRFYVVQWIPVEEHTMVKCLSWYEDERHRF